jgi:hypothetical protein
MPLMPYMMALKLETGLFVQAVNIAVGGLWATGTMSAPGLGLSILAVVPALAGVQLGPWARGHLPAGHYRSIVLAVLISIEVSLFVRA